MPKIIEPEGWGGEAKIDLPCSQQRRVRPTVCRSNELKRGETLQGQRSVSVAIILNKILEKMQEKGSSSFKKSYFKKLDVVKSPFQCLTSHRGRNH